jgi:DNA invertase Pin-like site-specific DNA recombinase
VPDLTPPPAGTLIGYARASTRRPLDHQLRALTRAGCATVFSDEPAGRTGGRPGLTACLASLQPGDTLVVPSLERLARSVHELLGLVADLCSRRVGFRSLDEDLDTTTRGGRQESAVFTALAEFLRQAETEGAQEGRVAARAGGQRLGRPPALTPDQVAHARRLLLDPRSTVSSVARTLGVSRSTVYRHLPELTGRTHTTR